MAKQRIVITGLGVIAPNSLDKQFPVLSGSTNSSKGVTQDGA